MWGKLTEFVQDKLESSVHEDDRSAEGTNDPKTTIENLRKALSDAEGRNKDINLEFKKLLREKENEIQRLHKDLAGGGTQNGQNEQSSSDYSSSVSGLQEQIANLMEQLNEKDEKLQDLMANNEERTVKRNKGSSQGGDADKRIEELEELLAQKDKNLQHLLQELDKAEQQSKQTWEQKRINEEKVMGELAAKIQHNTALITKLEETEQLLAEREKSIQELCDKNEAKERLIKSRDEVISQLQMSKDVSGGTDDVLSVLQEQIQSQQTKITELADEVDRYRRSLKEKESILATREKSLESIQHQMQEQTTALSQLTVERDNLIEKISSMEQDHNETVAMWQKQVKMKEEALAAEMSQLEISFKESEHMLREDVEEKANIIQSKDEAIAVLKRTIQERALGSPSPELGAKKMSEEGEKLVQVLEKQLEETKELLTRKSNALEKCEKELTEKQNETRELQLESQQQLKDTKEKLDTESLLTAELREQLTNKANELRDSEEKLEQLKEELNKTSKELSTTKDYLQEKSERLSKLEREDASGKVLELSQTVKKLENTLEERDAKITELNILTGKLQERVEGLTGDNEKVHNNLEGIEKDLNEQLIKLKDELKNVREKHEVELSEKDLKIKQQEEYLEEKDRTIGVLSKEMVEERGEIAQQLEGSLKEKASLENELKRCKNEMDSKTEENISLGKLVEELQGRVDDMAGELSKKVEEIKDQENSKDVIQQNSKPVKEVVECADRDSVRELAECPEPVIGKVADDQLQSALDEQPWSTAEDEDSAATDNHAGSSSSSVHGKIEELEKNFNEVKKQLTEEAEKNEVLMERLESLQEEKNNADVRCTELKQALEEFIYSTDKRGNKDITDKSSDDERQEMEETVQDGQNVSSMFQDQTGQEVNAVPATSESFGEVVRLLEEEKGTLERKLEVATKERNALRAHVEELEEMLENKQQPLVASEESQQECEEQPSNIEEIAKETDTLRTMVHESEEAEHQLQEQVRFYQEELQRESEDNEVLRNTLSHLETQLKKDQEELAAAQSKLGETLTACESIKMMMEEVTKENEKLHEENESLKNDLERTQTEAERANESNQQMLGEITVALNARVEEREELLRQAKMTEERLNDELQKLTSLNVSLEDANSSLREENKSVKVKDEEIVSLKQTADEKQAVEVELNNAKKLLAKMKKKFNSFREEKQAELEKKDEDISQLLDRVAEVENIRRTEGEKVDVEIKKLSQRIIEAEVVNEEVIKRKNQEINALSETVSQFENAKELTTSEKDKEIAELVERLRSAEQQQKRMIKEKEDEITGLKEDLQVELDNANAFVLSQINVLQRDLADSRNALAESEAEAELFKEKLLIAEEQLRKMQEVEEGLLQRLRAKESEVEQLRSDEQDESRTVLAEKDTEIVALKESMWNSEEQLKKMQEVVEDLIERLRAKESEVEQLRSDKQDESRTVLAEKDTEILLLKEKVSNSEEQLKKMQELENDLMELLRVKDEEVKQLKLEKNEAKRTVAVEETVVASKMDVSETQLEEVMPLRSADHDSSLQAKFQDKQIALQKQGEQLQVVAKKFAALKKKFTQQKEQMKELNEVNKQLKDDKEQLLKTCGELNERLATFHKLSEEKNILENSLNSRDSTLELLQAEIKRFRENVDGLENEKRLMETSLASSKDEVSFLRRQLDSASEQLESLESLSDQRDAFSEDLKLKNNEVSTLLEQLEESQTVVRNKEKEVEQLKKNMDEEFSTHSEQLAVWKSYVESSASEINELQNRLLEKDYVIDEKDRVIKERTDLVQENKEKITLLHGRLNEQVGDKSLLEEEVNKLISENEEMKSALEEKVKKESVLEREAGDLASLKERYEGQEMMVFNLRQQLQDACQQLEAMDELVEQKRSLEGLLEVREVEVNNLRGLTTDVETLRQKIDTKDKQIEELQDVLAEKSNTEKKLATEVESLRTTLGDAGLKIADLESSVQEQDHARDLQQQLDKKVAELQELYDVLSEKSAVENKLTVEVESLRTELSDSRVKIADLESSMQEQSRAVTLQEQLENKVLELQHLQELFQEKSALVETQSDELQSLRAEKAESTLRIANLENSIREQGLLDDIQERLKSTEEELVESQKSLEESQKRVQEIQGYCEELRAQNDSLELVLNKRDQEISILKDEVTKRVDLEKTVMEKDDETARIEEVRKSQDEEIERINLVVNSKNAEIKALRANESFVEQLSDELRIAKSTICGLEKRLETSKNQEIKDSEQLAKSGQDFAGGSYEASVKDDSESLHERITTLEKERTQLRKKLATMKKASVEIGKQNKHLQGELDTKENEISQLMIVMNESKKREKELMDSNETLRNDKDAMEGEFEDTVKELKEVTKEKQDLMKEKGSLKEALKQLEDEKDWDTSEKENLRVELEEKTNEYMALLKELQEMKAGAEEHVKKQIEDILMQKDLERAECEEEFAKQFSEVCAQKDMVISQLKDTSEELSSSKQQEIENLKEILDRKDNVIKELNESLMSVNLVDDSRAILDDLREAQDMSVSSNDRKIQELKEEIRNLKDELQIVGDGRESLDKKLHEALQENQKLREQLQLMDVNGDKPQKSEGGEERKELETLLREKEKMIAALKKKMKELRREKAAIEANSKEDAQKTLALPKNNGVEEPRIVEEVFQKTEVNTVEAVDDVKPRSVLESDYEKMKEELEHLRHERNVYEESYIGLQRDMDRTEKEMEALREDVQSKQDVIDGFDSRLQQVTSSLKTELESKMNEREKSLSEVHGKEFLALENTLRQLEEQKTRVETEMASLREEQKSLLEDKEEINKESLKMKNFLESTLEQLQTTQTELTSLKEKCSQLNEENERFQSDIGVTKKAKDKIKQKLKEVIRRNEEEKTALLEQVQQVKNEKAETCNKLRTEFEDALECRDNLVNNLKEKVDSLRTGKDESEERYEKLCRELRSSLNEQYDKNQKLEEEVVNITNSLENATSELDEVRKEKDTIGDTIRAEFDHICSGLRIDLENAIMEKNEFNRTLEVGRLGLEKELIEKEETFDGLMQIVKEKDEILNTENVESLKVELEHAKREVSTINMKLEQEQRMVEQKNAVIQSLEDDRKRLFTERDDALRKTQQEVEAVSLSKGNVIEDLEKKLTETTKEHSLLFEKYEQIKREFRDIVAHIVSSVKENAEDSSLLELVEVEWETVNDARKQSNMVVSKVMENWMETRRRLEKENIHWQAAEESYKLEIEKLVKEKEEKCQELEKKWQANVEEKDEVMESLSLQLDESHKNNEKIKEESAREMKQLKESLDHEQSTRLAEEGRAVEKLKAAELKLAEKQEELTRLAEQFQWNKEEIENLNKEKQLLEEKTEDLEFTVAEFKEQAESLQRDLTVVQNERNHFEQSLLENVERTNESIDGLLEILGKDHLSEMPEDTHKKSNELRNMLRKLVTEVERSREVEVKLKEEKTRVCQEIRKEFEDTLLEKEKILEELREKLKTIHKDYDQIKSLSTEKDNKMKCVQEEVTQLRSQLSNVPLVNDIVKESYRDGGKQDERRQQEAQHYVQENHLVTRTVVDDVMAETQEDALAASPFSSIPGNVDALQIKLDALNKEKASLKEQLGNLQNLYNERNSQTSLLVEDVIKLREENSSLKQVVESSKVEQSQILDLQERNNTMQLELEDLQLANKSLPPELEFSQAQNEDTTPVNEDEVKDELMAVIRDKETVTQRLEQDLMSYSREISELRDELARATKQRVAYEKLRRDFDHIVSGLRGDLERALSDREEKSRMLDDLRSQVRDGRVKDSNEEKQNIVQSQSAETMEKELENMKLRLREMTLVNRQLKQLGKSLDMELKETRKEKRESERKCQDLRNEMESFVKEKEAIIVESRERVETSERLHSDALTKLRKECDERIRKITTGNKVSSAKEYEELQAANEDLQMKLNDAYEEINNVAQVEETNSVLKHEVEAVRIENTNLIEKVEELKDMINEADGQIALRDDKIQELRGDLQRMIEEKHQIERQFQGSQGKQPPSDRLTNSNKEEYGSEGLDDAVKSRPDVIQFTRELKLTSESPKLEKELIQTRSEDVIQMENQVKYLRLLFEEAQSSKAVAEQELEKSRKISTKLKSMVKNARIEVESLKQNLESAKNEALEKEQTMQGLRSDMANLVKEKENLVEKLMSRLKASNTDKDQSLSDLRSECDAIVKKKEADIQETRKELTEASFRASELKSQLDMWRRSYNEMSERMNGIEDEMDQVKNALDVSLTEHAKTKEISSQKLTHAGETIETLTENLKNITQDLENSEKHNNELETSLGILKAEMDSIVSKKDSAITELHKQLDVTNDNLQKVSADLQETSRDYQELQQQIQVEEERFQSLHKDVNDSLIQKDDIIRQLDEDLLNANESISNISLRLQETSTQCEKLSTERDTLQEHLNETRKESENSSMIQEEVIADAGRNLEVANSRVEELFQKLNETSSMLTSERKRKDELDEISASLRKDLELRTEQKRELEDVVMNLNIDLEKALRDREELRQALRVKQTVTQGCDNARFDEELLREKDKEMADVKEMFDEKKKELLDVKQQLSKTQAMNNDLNNEFIKTEKHFQESLESIQTEKQLLEETIAKLQRDLHQSTKTKEEAVNVLRLKLEEAVEERGDLASSLKNEYDKMLSERDEKIANFREEIHRVNEEFTNLGYRFELTLQDNVNKGNKLMQLQNELKGKAQIIEENALLQQRLDASVRRVRELEEELDYLKDNSNKSDSEKLYDELQHFKETVKTLERQIALNRKESEVSKVKQKKEFKRLNEALQFDLDNSRKQNLEKERSLQNLRVELEEVVQQKEALSLRLRTPVKEKAVERLQRSADEMPSSVDGNLVEKLQEEKTELLRDLDKARQQKDEIFTKFHNISERLRHDLEEAINIRDEKVQEALKASVMLDKIERENSELRDEIKQKDTLINNLSANLEKKTDRNDSVVELLRNENEKMKATLAQELMNARQNILQSHNTNEELKQSLAKAEFDREKLRNYVATKEVENEELKRQLTREIAERKRTCEELRAGSVKNIEETILESSVGNYESFNETRNEFDETDAMFDVSVIDKNSRVNQLSARLAEATRVQEETNLQLTELEEALQEERTRREELEMLLDDEHNRRDHRVNIGDEETIPLTSSAAGQAGQFYSYQPSHINRRGQTSLLSLRGCLHSSGLLVRLLCGQARGRWPLMLYLTFIHVVLIVCLYSAYLG